MNLNRDNLPDSDDVTVVEDLRSMTLLCNLLSGIQSTQSNADLWLQAIELQDARHMQHELTT